MRRSIEAETKNGRFGLFCVRTGAATAILAMATTLRADPEYLTGLEWKKPPIITPGEKCGEAPSDAVILFNGKDMSAWNDGDKWKVENGVAIDAATIETKQHFGDCQLHIEWSAPVPATGTSQGRGNSGVFFGPFELQVLDSYQNETYFDGQAGAIYKQHPPMVNAMRPPGEWNVYDVAFTQPRFNDDGTLASPAFITAFHNGVIIQNHFQILGDTPFNHPPEYKKQDVAQPISLQFHGNPVRYRNIWVREMKPAESTRVKDPYMRDGDKETPIKSAASDGK